MKDRRDRVVAQDRPDHVFVADVPDDKFDGWRDGLSHASGKIVNDDDLFPAFQKTKHHVASDVASAARYENAHDDEPFQISEICERSFDLTVEVRFGSPNARL